MNDFHKTRMGQTFFGSHVPKLIKALERIADALEKKGDTSLWLCPECKHDETILIGSLIDGGIPWCPKCQEKGREQEMELYEM